MRATTVESIFHKSELRYEGGQRKHHMKVAFVYVWRENACDLELEKSFRALGVEVLCPQQKALCAHVDIPSAAFDCIICTQVLHLIFEVDKAVSELFRILKRGGVLLASVPHISMCDPGWHEIWRFTEEGLGAVVGRACGNEGITVRAYGNSSTAAGELRGLVTEEFSRATLEYHDPRFAVSVCVPAQEAR